MPKYKVHAVIKKTEFVGNFEAESKEEARKKAFKEACLYLDNEDVSEIDDLMLEEIKNT